MKNAEKRFLNPKEMAVLPEIEAASIKGNLVFFVGNGISRLYGLPSWENLTSKMINLLAEHGKIRHSRAQLLKKRSLKVKVSVADELFKFHRSDPEINYKKLLHFDRTAKAYQDLARCGAKFITTNYDTLLFEAYSGLLEKSLPVQDPTSDNEPLASKPITEELHSVRIAQSPHDFKLSDFLRNNVIWHLHGCIDKEENIIASTKDYLTLYNDEEIQKNLNHIFSTQVVVFIGYGLEEMELLDTIVRAAKSKQKDHRPQNIFYILPIYSYEFDIYQDLLAYYKSLNITVIPMSQDDHGYKAFEILIENWSGKISRISQKPSFTQSKQVMKLLIKRVEEAND